MLTEFAAATYRRFAAGFGGDGSCNDAGARQSMLDAILRIIAHIPEPQ